LPLDFAAAISGLDAVPPAGALEADFLVVLAEELAAGDGVVAGAGVVVAAAEAFWLLVFGADESEVLAVGADAAGGAASALADFFVLPLAFAVVAPDVPVASAGADAAVESALADFLLLFFAVVLSDELVVPAEAEL